MISWRIVTGHCGSTCRRNNAENDLKLLGAVAEAGQDFRRNAGAHGFVASPRLDEPRS